jgi:hypothetical protein
MMKMMMIKIFFSDLSDTPVGTGTLFVQDSRDDHKLVRENRCFNFLESEEAAVVQYLAAGGISHYSPFTCGKTPSRICSSFHAGPGQQVFGCGPGQRCNVLLAFFNSDNEADASQRKQPAVRLEFHNYHGSFHHYEGHTESCPLETVPYRPTDASSLFDGFRRQLATAFSMVQPKNVVFNYTVSTTCDYEHGGQTFRSLTNPPGSGGGGGGETTNQSIRELISTELTDAIWSKHPARWITKVRLLEAIVEGRETGFVTIIGGEEDLDVVRAHLPAGEPDAVENFGFCVQNFAPPVHLLSAHTRQQIRRRLAGSHFNQLNVSLPGNCIYGLSQVTGDSPRFSQLYHHAFSALPI